MSDDASNLQYSPFLVNIGGLSVRIIKIVKRLVKEQVIQKVGFCMLMTVAIPLVS